MMTSSTLILLMVMGLLAVLINVLLAYRSTVNFNTFKQQIEMLKAQLLEKNENIHQLHTHLTRLFTDQNQWQHEQRTRFDQHQINSLKLLQDSIQKHMHDTRQQVSSTLDQNTKIIEKQFEKLTQTVDNRLGEISGQVEKRLSEGFKQTTNLFNDVIKRLAMIDAAQQKITELSTNVVDLQSVLSDKRSRGAFGEVQLNHLIQNVLPESHFSLQHTLSNGKRADCLLFLPDPTGNVAIDAKFPLEGYRRITDNQLPESERKAAEQQFRHDIRHHIQNIASKYILPGETSDGAVMFIPAEAVFAEIHAHYPELVEEAQKARVWMTSPTTIMAILTTALAVLKDVATRKQVHIIQEHLVHLNKDFGRFQKRMDNLARHIQLASEDVAQVHTSSQKITARFKKIEQVEISAASAIEHSAD